jgi:hypothetical protein
MVLIDEAVIPTVRSTEGEDSDLIKVGFGIANPFTEQLV